MVEIGKPVPDISVPSTAGEPQSPAGFSGRWLVLYFYPRDATPGCTQEGQDFRDHYAEFQALNCEILGVSRDSLKKHHNFREKQQFPFHLLADEDERLCRAFDVIREKNLYGKKVMGIERSTFLIGPDATLRHEWRKVKVKGHVEEVLATLKAAQ